jgi:hypothetical protein
MDAENPWQLFWLVAAGASADSEALDTEHTVISRPPGPGRPWGTMR